MIAVSDMYLPGDFLTTLLKQCGYEGLEHLFVSCDMNASKHEGSLYQKIRERYGTDCSILHIGDNPYSDQKQALANGFSAVSYTHLSWHRVLSTGNYCSMMMAPMNSPPEFCGKFQRWISGSTTCVVTVIRDLPMHSTNVSIVLGEPILSLIHILEAISTV